MSLITHPLRLIVTTAISVGAVLFSTTPAMAGNVNWSLGFGVPGAQFGIGGPQRMVYGQAQSVYVQPAPVYVQPQPIYRQVQPVYQQAYPVYVQPQLDAPVGYSPYAPVYQNNWGAGYRQHHQHRHHHHHGR